MISPATPPEINPTISDKTPTPSHTPSLPIATYPKSKNLVVIGVALLVIVLSSAVLYANHLYRQSLNSNETNNTAQNALPITPAESVDMGPSVTAPFLYARSTENESISPGEVILAGNPDQNSPTSVFELDRFNGYLTTASDPNLHMYLIQDNLTYNYLLTWDNNPIPNVTTLTVVPDSMESPIFSPDGTQIAYTYTEYKDTTMTNQIWLHDLESGQDKLIATTPSNLIERPFRLIPFNWSADGSTLYLKTVTDSEATPKGIYQLTITDPSPQLIISTLPDVLGFSIDAVPLSSQVVHTSFEWQTPPDSRPFSGPPYKLMLSDLSDGSTQLIQENQTNRYHSAKLSPNRDQVAFSLESEGPQDKSPGLFVLDLSNQSVTKITNGVTGSDFKDIAWISNDELIFTEVSHTTGIVSQPVLTYLYYAPANGLEEKTLIDSARNVAILGPLSLDE